MVLCFRSVSRVKLLAGVCIVENVPVWVVDVLEVLKALCVGRLVGGVPSLTSCLPVHLKECVYIMYWFLILGLSYDLCGVFLILSCWFCLFILSFFDVFWIFVSYGVSGVLCCDFVVILFVVVWIGRMCWVELVWCCGFFLFACC